MQRKAYDIALAECFFCLQRRQHDVAFAHLCFQVNPRRVDTLCCYALLLVEQMVENLEAKIAHAHLIHIGEGQGNRRFHLVSRLHNAAELATGITGRLLDAA